MKKTILSIFAAAAVMCSGLSMNVDVDGARQVEISTTEELLAALEGARPGDRLILAPGKYQNDEWKGKWAAFFSEASGTSEQPITICSQDPDDPAMICGATQENKVGLHIIGEFWHLENLVVCNAGKGIVLDQASNSTITGCQVYDIGAEGIHLRDDTSGCLIENCYVHDCGTVSPQYGEGIYIGSAKGTTGYGFDCHYNTVRNCRISNVGADCIDIKEYTRGTLVEGCTLDGCGTQGQNGADSLIEVKGNDVILRNNVGYRSENEKIVQAVDLYNAVEGWGQNSRIYDNTFYMDRDDLFLVKGWNCSSYVFRNTSQPECSPTSGNKVASVSRILLSGDVNEDGSVDLTDGQTLQDMLLARPEKHYFSWENTDLCSDGRLDIYDMCALRDLLESGQPDPAQVFVNFTQEAAGKWCLTDGLGGRTLHVKLKAQPGYAVNAAWGYWDPHYTDSDTGKTGKWIQLTLGKLTLDENGETELTLELPEDVTRADVEVWDYLNGSEKLDKAGVEMTQAWFMGLN